jgi:hypothetical protein
MWRLPPRGRAGVQTIETDRLLVKISFSPMEVTQWLNNHDNHQWDEATMSFQVRGPTHDNPAEIETIYSFVRPYPAYRDTTNKYNALEEDNRFP